jgi:hypothetical protein
MYLPPELPKARVLISVKTYPLPSNKYDELVCTAGFLQDEHDLHNNGKWIRLYPVPFKALPYKDQYKKFEWIELDLVRNTSDFRPESYRPLRGIDSIRTLGEEVGTGDSWAKRKEYALKEVLTSMNELVQRAKSGERKSLATFKPREIIDFVIEKSEPQWKQEWRDHLLQYNLWDLDKRGEGKTRKVVPKLPFKYSYKFLSDGDERPRKLMIEDWEIGGLYSNCLRSSGGDTEEANRLVRKKYFDEFLSKKDLYLFLGTTLQFQLRAPQPFLIIGVFYPPKTDAVQLSLL